MKTFGVNLEKTKIYIKRVIMFKAGLVSVSFRSLSVEEIIAATKLTNLKHIEWGSDIHAPHSDLQNLRHIADLCEQNGINRSYGTYFRFGRDSLEELLPYIQAAKILNAKILRVWCGTKSSNEYTVYELPQLYKDCKAAARLAEEAGVTLGLECHNWTLTDTKESALALMKEVNSPAFKMFWQPNQFKSVQENLEYAKLLAPYVICIHAFNWEGDNKYPLAFAKETWVNYLRQFSSNLPVLLEFMPDDKIETLSEESKTLQNILTQPSISK